jgi:hypothetical protein
VGRFRSGADDVFESNFKDVLDVLGGPSPWQHYIKFNLMVAQNIAPDSVFKDSTFRVESKEDFESDTKKLGDLGGGIGVTDKKTGSIFLEEWGTDPHHTFLLAALHECVHLVSDPASQGAKWSTAHQHLKGGLLEGFVEAVTEDILTAQNISLPEVGMRGHQERLTIVRALMDSKNPQDVQLWGRLLFQGNWPPFVDRMTCIFSPKDWEAIKNLAVLRRTKQALDRISSSRSANSCQ